MRVGVLALQGAFREHCIILKKLKVTPIEIRTKKELDTVDALILPGGESTTITKLLAKYGLDKEIVKMHKNGMPIYGTCAGAILLAKKISNSKQSSLKLADISISRNAYGTQVDSFESKISIKGLKKKFTAIFIRAPIIDLVGKEVEILSKHKNHPVLIRQGNILISTFHPELTKDTRIHRYFIEMVKNK